MKKEKNAPKETPVEDVPAAAENTETKPSVSVAKERPAKVTKVGAMLKEMRLQKGFKTADIAKRLCIRKVYIEAIEDSNYKEIPPLPYGIGFIRSYANFLGLNSENIVDLYKEETNISEPKNIKVLEPQPEANMPSTQYLLISLLAIGLIYMGWNLFNHEFPTTEGEPSHSEEPLIAEGDSGVVGVEDFNFEPPAEEAPSADEPQVIENLPKTDDEQITVSDADYPLAVSDKTEAAVQPLPQAQTTEALSAVAGNKAEEEQKTAEESSIPNHGVFIEVLKETWVEVKDENKLYLSKVLYKGDTYTVPEGKGMVLSFGKYDGAKVYINGKLTEVARPNKKTNIALDPLIEALH